MNEYVWYWIFNHTQFLASGLVSKQATLDLEDIGDTEILITRGNLTSLVINGVMLSLNLNDENPFEFDSGAIYIDDDQNVWYGVLIED
jgi:hypothetical protein